MWSYFWWVAQSALMMPLCDLLALDGWKMEESTDLMMSAVCVHLSFCEHKAFCLHLLKAPIYGSASLNIYSFQNYTKVGSMLKKMC